MGGKRPVMGLFVDDVQSTGDIVIENFLTWFETSSFIFHASGDANPVSV
jgi:hypothetical protein